MVTNVCVHHQERVPDSPSPVPSLDDGRRSVSHLSSRQSSSVSSSPAHTESSSDRPRTSAWPHKSHFFFCFIPLCLFTKSTLHIQSIQDFSCHQCHVCCNNMYTFTFLFFLCILSYIAETKHTNFAPLSLVPEHLALCSYDNVKLHI